MCTCLHGGIDLRSTVSCQAQTQKNVRSCKSSRSVVQSGMDEAARRADHFGGWNPCSQGPAPEALMNCIMHRDLSFRLAKLPAWRTLPAAAFALGSIQQGKQVACRLLLRNRGEPCWKLP